MTPITNTLLVKLYIIFCKNNLSLLSCIFPPRDYFEYAFMLLDNSLVSRLLGMYDTDLKRRTVELAYGFNLVGSKHDFTTPIGARQTAKLLGVRNQSSIVKWRQEKHSDRDIKDRVSFRRRKKKIKRKI